MVKILGINHLDVVRALEKAAYWVRRQGKHIVMSNGGAIIVIPRHNPVNVPILTSTSEPAARCANA